MSTETLSPFDTIPGIVADALASEMFERPVPCELAFHDHDNGNPAAYLGHFKCGDCDRSKPYLMCEDCRHEILTEAVICAECGTTQPGWDAFVYFIPIGGPA